MDRGAWWATVHGVSKSRTRLKRLSTHARTRVAAHSVLFLFFKSLWMREKKGDLASKKINAETRTK